MQQQQLQRKQPSFRCKQGFNDKLQMKFISAIMYGIAPLYRQFTDSDVKLI